MNRELWIRAGALYFPIVLALVAGLLRSKQPKSFAACLLGSLWSAITLPLIERLNECARWWNYRTDGPSFCGMPLELYLGWIVLWGILPQLALFGLRTVWCATLFVALDTVSMPLCAPVVQLRPLWLIGELVTVCAVLVPALFLARWTVTNRHLRVRAALQLTIAAVLFLYLVPELIFAIQPGRDWAPLLEMSPWIRQLAAQILLVLALPAVSAVMEFAVRGRGTPIPYDSPERLVTSGIYRYCANPMQASCALVMLVWAALLRNGWLLAAATTSIVYSAGLAEWDESHDMEKRFGPGWMQYRSAVRNWWPRWRPFHMGSPARLYIAATCGPCSELRAWLEQRSPEGMTMIAAETLAPGSVRRLRYDPGDDSGAEEGVRALGRALEHLSFGWAIAGMALRLPIVWQGIQLVMDASGLGPREIRQVSRVN